MQIGQTHLNFRRGRSGEGLARNDPNRGGLASGREGGIPCDPQTVRAVGDPETNQLLPQLETRRPKPTGIDRRRHLSVAETLPTVLLYLR